MMKERHCFESVFGGAKQKRLYRRWFFTRLPPMPGWPSTSRVHYPHQHATGAWFHP